VAANDALNQYYGVTDCPVGLYRGDVKVASDYREICKTIAGGRRVAEDRIQDGVCALRKVLADACDGSVRIVATGFASNLASLLATRANHKGDGIPLSGCELAARKVQFLSIMACDFNAVHTQINPLGEFNVIGDIPAMARLMAEWPTRMVISDFLLGQLAPIEWKRVETSLPARHPLLVGYRKYYDHGNGGSVGDRPSWDLTAMLYALEPDGDHFGLSDPGEVTIREDGVSVFHPCAGGRRRHLLLDAAHPPTRLADVLHARVSQRTEIDR
jgi:inosine-uridine nucleoside N-ribohydrolase